MPTGYASYISSLYYIGILYAYTCVGFCIVACLWQVGQCETPQTAGQVTETRLPRFLYLYVSTSINMISRIWGVCRYLKVDRMSHRKKNVEIVWFACFLSFFPLYVKAQTTYRVTAQKVNVRSAPSTQSTVVGTLVKDDTISVSGIVRGWASFLFKGKNRYVSSRYIEEVVLPEVVEEVVDTIAEEVVKEVEEVPVEEVVQPTKPQRENNFFNRVFGTSAGDLHLIADIWGGYSNFAWNDGSPNMRIGFGADVGIQCNYRLLWNKIPQGLFGELTAGYAWRGSAAFPIHYIGFRVLPLAYRQSFSDRFSIVGKAGLYMGVPLSKVETSRRKTYDTYFDYGLSVGIGVEYGKWGLLASYEHGFAKVVNNSRVDLYNRGAFLTLSYKFLKIK